MRNVDYIIVGDGYAALFFAHQLILHQQSFVLFSGERKGASRVSAGVFNPVVLKKFTTFWLADEQIDFLTETMSEIQNYTGTNYLIKQNIHRIFHDEKEKELWMSKINTEELGPFLNSESPSLNIIKNSFGTGSVKKSGRINVDAFFKDFMNYFKENNHLIQEQFDYSLISGNKYKDINFKHLVFCEGSGVRQNPFFKDIPIIPNKGHHLKVKLSQKMNHQHTLKKKHFLFPVDGEMHYYGGTYDPNEREDKIDDFKTEELIAGLEEFYPHKFEIAEINYGVRPTVKDRRPILGNHPDHRNFYVFNGLGGRGILNGCYFSKELYEHIEHAKDLMVEVDLRRFNK